MAYWDTSAVVKLYAAEDDSAYFLELVAELDEPIVSSTVLAAEVLCAFYRKEAGGALKRGTAAILAREFTADIKAGRIVALPYSADVEDQIGRLVKMAFARIPPLLGRSLDVIHVATALASKSRVVVATDTRLREMAALTKLQLLP